MSRNRFVRLITSSAILLTLSSCAWFNSFSSVDERAAIDRTLRKVAKSSQTTHDYAAAVRYYERLHEANPQDVGATLGLARNLRYLGTPKRAAQVLEQALTEGPDNPNILAELGRALIASGEPERALKPLSEAMSMSAGNWQTLSAIGVANDQLGRHETARSSYFAAQALSPENVAVLNNLALSWALSGRLARAVKILEDATKLPQSSVQVRQNLALMHGIQGNDKRAYELARLDLPEEAAKDNIKYYVSLREGVQPGIPERSSLEEGNYSVQVGAFASPSNALNAWHALKRLYPDLLAPFQAEIYDKKDGGNAPFVAWAGPMESLTAATGLCTELRARGSECLVVRQ